MKILKHTLSAATMFVFLLAGLGVGHSSALSAPPQYVASISHNCNGGNFLSFPTWYEYLPGQTDKNGLCSPQIDNINDVWLIVAAVIEILLRVAAIAAVGFVIYGGVRYSISQGEPDQTAQARSTIVNALVGLLISVTAAALVSFVAGSIT